MLHRHRLPTLNFIFKMETPGIIAGVRVEGNQNHALDPSGWWDSGSTILANLFQ